MKVLHVNHRDSGGGAALLGQMLHTSLCKQGIDSQMYVSQRTGGDNATKEIQSGLAKLTWILTKKLSRALEYCQFDSDSAFYSLNLFANDLPQIIACEKPDIVHLHWTGGETMQIESLAKIEVPIVWTLHDMWPFTGSEHIVYPMRNTRWVEGYTQANRPKALKGVDLNRWCWQRKASNWAGLKITPVAPSQWMKDCVDQSALSALKVFNPSSLIPHGIKLSEFYPEPMLQSREQLGIPSDKPVLLFGAHLLRLRSKGISLLSDALQELAKDTQFTLVTFGKGNFQAPKNIQLINLGEINDSSKLRSIYSSADLTLLPSMIESFGLVAAESLACGTPLVCFDITGQKDMVDSPDIGYRAHPFDSNDFCKGIRHCLSDRKRLSDMRQHARKKAERCYDSDRMIQDYLRLYEQLLAKQ